jgi:hypothetical protein
MLAGFWRGNLKDRDNLEYLGAVEKIMLKYSVNKEDRRAYSGLIWFRIGRIDGRL